MDLLDRLLGHDAWTTRRLLLACKELPAASLDEEFEIDHRSLRKTFVHMIENIEIWTDLLYERPVERRKGDEINDLLERQSRACREFAHIAHKIIREQRGDEMFLDVLDNPPQLKTYGGVIGHLITHSMHHRAQVMYLMEKVGLQKHIEGDLLSWEAQGFGWGEE